MCRFKQVHKDETGSVVKCNGCGHYHVNFGNIQFVFTEDQLHEFTKTIESYNKAYADEPVCDSRSINIPTAARGVNMCCSTKELRQFYTLLQQVRDRLNKERLFVFNYN